MGEPAGPSCTLQPGVEFLGDDVAPPAPAAGESACCTLCSKSAECNFFTYYEGHGETNRGTCYLKNTNAPDYSRHNTSCTSGFVGSDPPTPNAPADVAITVGESLSPGGPNHVCWNIDASANRGFFWRNLSAADGDEMPLRVLQLHATADSVVHREVGRRLFRAFPSELRTRWLESPPPATHEEVFLADANARRACEELWSELRAEREREREAAADERAGILV